MLAAGTYDPNYMLAGHVDTPPATRESGSHSFAEPIPMGASSTVYNPKCERRTQPPAARANGVDGAPPHNAPWRCAVAEWEDRTAKERQERNNAASLKDTEMKQEAESGLAKFHADRKAANAEAETKNVADEQAAAEALANETNPWNTVFSMCADPSLAGPPYPPAAFLRSRDSAFVESARSFTPPMHLCLTILCGCRLDVDGSVPTSGSQRHLELLRGLMETGLERA